MTEIFPLYLLVTGFGLQIPWPIRGDRSHKGRGFDPGRAERDVDSFGDGLWRWRQMEGETTAALEVSRAFRPSSVCASLDVRRSLIFTGMAALRAGWATGGRSF
jgi:hypothetical protein